jgi:hypothetical protein
MGGLRAVWERQFGTGSVVGLAPSAAAAQVLAEEFGVATENTSKWLTEQTRQSGRLAAIDELRVQLNRAGPSLRASMLRRRIDELSAEVDKWSLRSGQLVVVDEASLAGTFALDTLTEQARNAGAKVVLVGDWAQLSPVEAGGAFHMLVRDRDLVPALADVRRFTHAWEKVASIDLRVGHPAAVDAYEERNRVEGGDRESMLDLLHNAWRADVAAGHRSLMIASDKHTVAALNERARAHRVAAREVRENGIQTVSGVVIGVGDLVVTRQNNRLLSCGRGWVKNGDQWLVQEVAADGAVTVARTMGAGMPGGRQVVLPADYVRQHVELGYATTAHRAQGRTVDTAHAFVSVTTQREVLYVAATRGRESNRLYVDTMYDPDADTQHGLPAERDAGDVLRQVLEARGADQSATETIAADWAEQHGIVRMWAEYDTIAGVAQRERYDELVTSSCSGVPAEQVEGLRDSAAYGPLLAALREAEAFGLDVEHGLQRLVNGRTLSSADDVAAVLHGRVDRWISASSPQRCVAADRIVGLFPRLSGVTDADMARALDDRQTLIEQRAREVVAMAVENRQPWAARLGSPPSDPFRRELWLRRLDTVAAYRERWAITDRTVLGTREPTSLEQEAQRRLAQFAVDGALSITREEKSSVSALGQTLEGPVSREGAEM